MPTNETRTSLHSSAQTSSTTSTIPLPDTNTNATSGQSIPRATQTDTSSSTSTVATGDYPPQLIVISAPNATSTHARLSAFDYRNDKVQTVWSDIPARLGRAGIHLDRVEGDGSTPAGTFGFKFAFGGGPDPGTSLEYRPIEEDSCWISEPGPDYNRWTERSNCAPPNEHLSKFAHDAYLYSIALDYNYDNPEYGRGSAIFLHVSTGTPTAGCISIDKDILRDLLRWLQPGAQIRIEIVPD